MEISTFELRILLKDAAEMGAQNALSKAGIVKEWISRAEAYRRYGERTVRRWIDENKIKPRRPSPKAAKAFINLMEIEAANKAFNTPIYQTISKPPKKWKQQDG